MVGLLILLGGVALFAVFGAIYAVQYDKKSVDTRN